MRTTAIIVAAGKGRRMGKEFNKQYIYLAGKPIVAYTLDVFEKSDYIDEIILIVGKDEIDFNKEQIIKKYDFKKTNKVIAGGAERQDSVYQGLMNISDDCDIVLIHDGARPFINEELIVKGIEVARVEGNAVIAVPVKDTIKKANKDLQVIETPKRQELWAVQTPQIFQRSLIEKAYKEGKKNGIVATDDATMVEHLGYYVNLVQGCYENIKITTPDDLIIGEAILNKRLGGNS